MKEKMKLRATRVVIMFFFFCSLIFCAPAPFYTLLCSLRRFRPSTLCQIKNLYEPMRKHILNLIHDVVYFRTCVRSYFTFSHVLHQCSTFFSWDSDMCTFSHTVLVFLFWYQKKNSSACR